ncbi:MAG TPA: DUF2946 family protein [Rubrivivax sp.]|nr:DUF2946 family protein [Rubrivivax sp.]
MPLAYRHRRPTLWIALLAILFAALAPAISHGLAAGSSTWIELCTAQGSRWIAVDTGGAEQPAGSNGLGGGHFDHCPFCHLSSPAMAPPPAHAWATRLPELRDGLPERFLSAPQAAHIWRAAQPRAPPLTT